MRSLSLHSLALRPLLATLTVAVACGGVLAGCEGAGLAHDPPEMPPIRGELPTCAQPVATYFDEGAIAPPGRDTEYDVAPQRDLGFAFAEAFALGTRGRLVDMAARLGRAEIEFPFGSGVMVPAYTVCQDVQSAVVLFRPPAGSGLPVMAWRTEGARRLIVEAPHPFHEAYTLEQGVEAFFDFRARALIVSGAHRCASQAHVACSGRSTACDDEGDEYRESDPAHNPETVFHAMHVALTEAYRSHFAISLHGVGHERVVVSDGTEISHGPAARGLVAAAAYDLHEVLEGEAEVLSCNGVQGMGDADRHCGTTNAQGRHLNRAADICLEDAEMGYDRFMHLEQPRYVRETDALRTRVLRTVFDRLDPFGA